jgi:enamine deaminase RidA (YjgF/YER057c/UK114 family)
MSDRHRVRSASPYEAWIGFTRAVRAGNRILVSATGPIAADGTCAEGAGEQARRCLEIIFDALAETGGAPRHVVRTRVYFTDSSYIEAVGKAHCEAFADIRPASTIVAVAGLADPRWKVEIEAEAVVS